MSFTENEASPNFIYIKYEKVRKNPHKYGFVECLLQIAILFSMAFSFHNFFEKQP